MIAAVFSDSHKDLKTLKAAAEEAKGFGAKKFIHLGDNYADADVLYDFSDDVVRVPGLWCPEYSDARVKNRLIIDLWGFKTLLTHSHKIAEQDLPGDGDPDKILKDQDVDILLYGHTHIYECIIRGDRLDMNPGTCKAGDKRSTHPTYGLIKVEGKKATGRVIILDGIVLAETTLIKM